MLSGWLFRRSFAVGFQWVNFVVVDFGEMTVVGSAASGGTQA